MDQRSLNIDISEFASKIDTYMEEAQASGYITVTENGERVGAFLGLAEYQNYLRLKSADVGQCACGGNCGCS